VCSKSILFDPLDLADPVIKLAYRDFKRIEQWKPPRGLSSRIGGNTFFVAASQVTEMLQGNIIAPYNIKSKEERRLLFSLNYANIHSLLSQIITVSACLVHTFVYTFVYMCPALVCHLYCMYECCKPWNGASE